MAERAGVMQRPGVIFQVGLQIIWRRKPFIARVVCTGIFFQFIVTFLVSKQFELGYITPTASRIITFERLQVKMLHDVKF